MSENIIIKKEHYVAECDLETLMMGLTFVVDGHTRVVNYRAFFKHDDEIYFYDDENFYLREIRYDAFTTMLNAICEKIGIAQPDSNKIHGACYLKFRDIADKTLFYFHFSNALLNYDNPNLFV